jgi:Tol biopolymer transport system component
MPLPDGAPKRIEVANNFIYDTAWTADGKDVVATVEQGGTNSLWRVPVDGGQPARIAGLDDGASQPAVSASGHLAYSRSFIDENIWGLAGSTKTEIIASTRRDFNPQFSPDATRIAFSSDRTGGWEIYVSDAQGGHGLQLTSFGSAVVDAVRWSPDGRELAFAVLQRGNRDIYVVPSEGGAARRMTNESSDEGRPSFSMDGKWIYFRSNRSGKDEIWKMPRAGGEVMQVTQGGGFEATETWDGKTLYFLRSRAVRGLWSMPSSGGTPQAVPGLESVSQGKWGVTDDGVCYVESVREQPMNCWASSTRKSSRIGSIDKPMFNAPPVFSVSRDGKRFLWNQSDHQDADLVLVENFR